MAVAAAIGATMVSTAPVPPALQEPQGTYVSGDFHNHTTCSDGSISMQKLVKKSTDKGYALGPGLVRAGRPRRQRQPQLHARRGREPGHAGYPLVVSTDGRAPRADHHVAELQSRRCSRKVRCRAPRRTRTCGAGSRCRNSSTRSSNTSRRKDVPLFIGVESVVAGHEHTSISVITGQMPVALDSHPLPTGPATSPSATRLRWRVGVLLRPQRHGHQPWQPQRR